MGVGSLVTGVATLFPDIAVAEISVENGELAPADTSRLVGEKRPCPSANCRK